MTTTRLLIRACIALLFSITTLSSQSQTCTFPNQTVTAAGTVLNTYYPGNASIAAGSTSITLGTSIGAATPITAGDIVLIIQMQEATMNSTNTNAYGDGVAAAPASGLLTATAGTYEFAIAANSVPVAGGTLNLFAGTTNTYNTAAATATQGQTRFQVIRVPRYNNLTINAATGVAGSTWNGTAGGVIALNVNGTLNMNTTGTINANGIGFRPGGGRQLGGGAGANTDIRTNATVNNNGAKGEGIAGTPRYLFNGTALVNTGVEGYPNGSNANGAPGNAGGGGTDGNPASNDENTGGGGGANGGAGGRGGRSWNSNLNTGGYGGGAPAFLATSRLILGGGGGAGSTNDGTGSLGAGLSSSGGAGGGIVFLSVNTITNPGTITANGINGGSVDNDGGGGGGAGGSVYVSAVNTASLATLTINAIGGRGGNAWATVADAGAANDGNPEHGPGGGGGGGVIFTNGAIVAGSSVAGGANGITTTSNLAFGSTAGAVGIKNTAAAAIVLPAITAPVASSNSTICQGSTLNLTCSPTIAAATYAWTGPNSFTSAVQNPSIAGATSVNAGTYSVSYTLGPCTAGPSNTVVAITSTPTTSNAGPDQTICANTATMAGNTPAAGTGSWTQISGPVTATITTPASPSTTISGITTAGTYVFQWTIANAPCTASADQVNIIRNAVPTTANAGPDQTICASGASATMAGNTPASGTGTWTQVSGPVTATITTPGSPTTTITGLNTAGTYVFQWTIANAPCTASTDQISVIVNAVPTTANAGPDQTICANTATMAGNTPASGNGTWTQVSGPVTATITTPGSPTTSITGLTTAGTYVFRWTITNAPCTASNDQVNIIRSATPTTANAGPDQTICASGASATMAGNTPAIGIGAWTQVSGPVTATITTPGSPTTTITGMNTAGTYVFQWLIANAPCTASADQINVIVNSAPTVANAGPDKSVCGTVAAMAGNTPVSGTGTWSQVSGPVTATIVSPSSPTTTITGMTTIGTYVFQWRITNAPCAASADQVNIVTNAAGPITPVTSGITLPGATPDYLIHDASCFLISKVEPAGASPLSGPIFSQAFVEPSTPSYGGVPYVSRHYKQTASVLPATATANVTLYFTQAEFNSFNAHPSSALDLPTGPADAAGIANLRISHYAGTSSNGSGQIGTYPGSATIIDPADVDIVYNSLLGRWEVTIRNVIASGGFFVQTFGFVLPVNWISFHGELNGSRQAVLHWKVSEQGAVRYEVERADDGIRFYSVGSVNSTGDGVNSYTFTDLLPVNGKAFYRIRQVMRDGRTAYSAVMLVSHTTDAASLSIHPNPVTDLAYLHITLNRSSAIKGTVVNQWGQVIYSFNKSLNAGTSVITLSPGYIAAGVYHVIVEGEGFRLTQKMVKK